MACFNLLLGFSEGPQFFKHKDYFVAHNFQMYLVATQMDTQFQVDFK